MFTALLTCPLDFFQYRLNYWIYLIRTCTHKKSVQFCTLGVIEVRVKIFQLLPSELHEVFFCHQNHVNVICKEAIFERKDNSIIICMSSCTTFMTCLIGSSGVVAVICILPKDRVTWCPNWKFSELRLRLNGALRVRQNERAWWISVTLLCTPVSTQHSQNRLV